MEAKVKQESRWGSITAFSGCEFVKSEWRAVPAGCEAEAMRNEYLETREKPVEVAPIEAEAAPIAEQAEGEKAEKVAPKKARGKQ